MSARGVAVASGMGLTVALGIYSLMGSFGGPFETSHSPVADPLTLNTLKVGVVDAGTVYAHALRNVDGGAVYAPGGVTIDSMKYLTFNGPGGTGECHHTGGALVCNGGGGLKFGIVGGGFSQEEFKAGELSANALQINGGALRTSVSAVAGTGGPSADAGIDMVPIGEGVVWVWGAGLRTHTVGNADGGGVLDLRGDVQIDDNRPIVSVHAATDRQALDHGSKQLSGGAGVVTFETAFASAPDCLCDTSTGNNVTWTVTETTLTLTGTGTDTVTYICVGAR